MGELSPISVLSHNFYSFAIDSRVWSKETLLWYRCAIVPSKEADENLQGALAATMFFYDFANRAVPSLDEYCSKNYGAQWDEVKKKVPYKLFPGIY